MLHPAAAPRQRARALLAASPSPGRGAALRRRRNADFVGCSERSSVRSPQIPLQTATSPCGAGVSWPVQDTNEGGVQGGGVSWGFPPSEETSLPFSRVKCPGAGGATCATLPVGGVRVGGGPHRWCTVATSPCAEGRQSPRGARPGQCFKLFSVLWPLF